MSTTLVDLNAMLEERGYPLPTWEMRGETIWIRVIAAGGIDDPVYEWRQLGTIEEEAQMIRTKYEPRDKWTSGYCEHCEMYSTNIRLHNCQHIEIIRAEEARRA